MKSQIRLGARLLSAATSVSGSVSSCSASARSSSERITGRRGTVLFLTGFAQNGFDAHRRILQIGTGFALEPREPLKIENIARRAIV